MILDSGRVVARSVLGKDEADEKHGGRHVEGGAWGVDDRVGADGFAEDLGEEAGADETGDAAKAVDGSLQLALLGGTGLAGEDALGGGPGEGHQVEDGDAEP